MSGNFEQRSIAKRKNKLGLALAPKPPQSASPSPGDAQIPGAIGNEDRGDTLEIGMEFQLDLRSEDLKVIKELGAGNGGTVSKVQHAATKVIMARKVIHVEAKKEVRKRIVRELQIMFECNSPYIVSFYGAFMNDAGDVIMCMEYMDCGSLDEISKKFGPVRVDVLGKIAEAILGGLNYLYQRHHIMHRDIKPSNVLVNSRGYIKLCDFGVSSELVNSVADTFVGTGTYMAPERIQGSPYTVKSDVWSVGLTLMELAIGKFPFESDKDDDDDEPTGPQGILDLLQQIVLEPSPKLPKSDAFPAILEHMIEKCMMKDPAQRPTPQELFDQDPFLQAAKRTPVDLEAWAVSMMEKDNRKSHLVMPTSPILPSALHSAPAEDKSFETGDIPIGNLSLNGGDVTPHASAAPHMQPQVTTPHANPQITPQRPQYPTRTSSANRVPGLNALSGGRTAPPSGGLPMPPPRRTDMNGASQPGYGPS